MVAINNIKLSIDLEIKGLSDKKLEKLIKKFDNGELSFEELNAIFVISERKYLISSINYPIINRPIDKEDVVIKEIKINMIA
jgi:hypothetical protein